MDIERKYKDGYLDDIFSGESIDILSKINKSSISQIVYKIIQYDRINVTSYLGTIVYKVSMYEFLDILKKLKSLSNIDDFSKIIHKEYGTNIPITDHILAKYSRRYKMIHVIKLIETHFNKEFIEIFSVRKDPYGWWNSFH